MAKVKFLIALLTISSMFLGGCALTTGHANVQYAPEDPGKSPLSTIEPMTVYIEVVDQRPTSERDKVGDKKNSYGMTLAPILLEKDAQSVIRDALTSEFVNNGHDVILSENDNPDLVVNIGLNRIWGDMRMRLLDVEIVGTINTDVTIIKQGNQKACKKLITTSRRSEQMGSAGAIERALNDALKEYVRNFSRDPVILDAIRE